DEQHGADHDRADEHGVQQAAAEAREPRGAAPHEQRQRESPDHVRRRISASAISAAVRKVTSQPMKSAAAIASAFSASSPKDPMMPTASGTSRSGRTAMSESAAGATIRVSHPRSGVRSNVSRAIMPIV